MARKREDGSKAERFAQQKRWSESVAREVLDELVASGMTVAAFARSRGLDVQRLWWWSRRIGRSGPVPATMALPQAAPFAPVHIVEARQATPSALRFEVVLSTGRKVRLGDDFDTDSLQRLVRALEEVA